MGILDSLSAPTQHAGVPGPTDDFWYTNQSLLPLINNRSAPIAVLQVATALACVQVVSDAVGTLPCILYRKTDEGRERAEDQHLYEVLKWAPNPWQSAFEFWQMAVVFKLLWNNFYAEIRPGLNGPIDSLWPIHPDAVSKVDQLPNGKLVYQIRLKDGTTAIKTQDEIFHIKGMSIDSKMGVNVLALVRESINLSMAATRYGTKFFSNGARPSGFIEMEGSPNKEARDTLRESWDIAQSGVENSHKVAVLAGGMKWKASTTPNNEAQFLETRKFQATEICQIFKVPPHTDAILERSTNNNIEEQGRDFRSTTLLPITTMIQHRIRADLIIDKQHLFAKFLFDALLQANLETRAKSQTMYVQSGIKTVNEIRKQEEMNALPGGDELFKPLNMGNPGGRRNDGQPQSADAVAFIQDTADRMVRKETAAITKAAQRHPDDDAAFQKEVQKFYHGHAASLPGIMYISEEQAKEYCSAQMAIVFDRRVAAVEEWGDFPAGELVSMFTGPHNQEAQNEASI